MRSPLAALLAGGFALATLSGCVVHKHYGTPSSHPPPPPRTVTVEHSHHHVHNEYCVAYTDLYGCSHADIVWLESRGCSWDDMGIMFYLWWGCGRRYTIYDVHRWHYVERVSWHVCFTRARVDIYGMFVHVDYTPHGPCGRAYGHYHKRTHLDRFRFHDDDIRAVYRVNVAVNYYKQPPRQAFDRVRDRKSFQTLVRNEHSRQNRPQWHQTQQGRKEREDRDRADRTPPGQGRDDRTGRTPPGQGRDDRTGRTPPGRDDRTGRTPPGRDDRTGRTPPGQDRGSSGRPPSTRGGGSSRGGSSGSPPSSRDGSSSRGGSGSPPSSRGDNSSRGGSGSPPSSRGGDSSRGGSSGGGSSSGRGQGNSGNKGGGKKK